MNITIKEQIDIFRLLYDVGFDKKFITKILISCEKGFGLGESINEVIMEKK